MASLIPTLSTSWLKRLHISLAAALIALSTSMLIGWFLQFPPLIQWSEAWPPIPANAAICFAIFGALFLAIETGYRRAALLALIPCALGLVTELQNHLPLHLPLDEQLATDYLQIEIVAPGRMPAALSWCFIIGGLSLPLIAICKRYRFCTLNLAFAGSALMAVGCSTLLGYILGLPAVYRWSGTSSLPPVAAVLLILLGTAFLLLAWREHRSAQPGAPVWLPMPVVVASTMLSVILWIGLREREHAYLGNTTQITLNSLASSINTEFEHEMATLERYSRQWGQFSDLSPVIWETDARMMLNDTPDCSAILWISPMRRTIWAYPSHGNEALNAFDHDSEPERRAALNAALQKRAAAISASLSIQTLGRGFVIYCPVYHGTELVGYAGSEFTYRRFFSNIDRKLKITDNYRYSLSISGDSVFATNPNLAETTENRLEAVFNIFDRRLRIEISPSTENLRRNRRPLPEVTLLAGLGITALLGLSVHLARAARTSLRTARLTNLQLFTENDERRRIEAMLKVSDEQLRLALDSTQIGIFEWNLTVNQLYYSSGVWTMLGYLPGIIPSTPEAWTSLIHSADLPAYRTAIEEQLKGTALFIDPDIV